jgi:hypothetical protein
MLGAITEIGTACSTRGAPEEVASDVEAYLVRMRSWAVVEAEMGHSTERILATQFVDDSAVLHEIDDGMPRLRAQLRRIKTFQPRTRQVKSIHAQYVEAWERLEQGYVDIERGVRGADARDLAAGRQALLDWRRGLRTVATKLRALQQDYPPPKGS